jgi:hypothetical protein
MKAASAVVRARMWQVHHKIKDTVKVNAAFHPAPSNRLGNSRLVDHPEVGRHPATALAPPLGRKTPKPRICPGECGPEVPIEEVDSTTLNAMLLVGCQNCSQATEVKSDSRYFRFVIAKHSPERVLETGLLM